MKRQVIVIDEDKCVGCGLCASACEQGAIQLIDGKAKLVSDSYCDGLGMCLPSCPVDAITLVEQEAKPFDPNRKGIAKQAPQTTKTHDHASGSGCGCQGSAAKAISRPKVNLAVKDQTPKASHKAESTLGQWPVQISLISPNAPYLRGADLLIAADCTAFAYGNFHAEFIKNRITMIGCPKLDHVQPYIDKLVTIFTTQDIQSVTVTRMNVPCCGGIVSFVKQALVLSGMPIPYHEVIITTDGHIQ